MSHLQKKLQCKGRIELIFGPMFSGKTTELIRRIKRFQFAKFQCLVFKYEGDKRYSDKDVSTHDERTIPALSATTLMTHMSAAMDYDVIGIDEGQFFTDIIPFAEELANEGKTVIIAALDGTFERISFGSVVDLLPLAEEVIKLSAVCLVCCGDASFTQRISDDKDVEIIGGADKYRAVCSLGPIPYVSDQEIMRSINTCIEHIKEEINDLEETKKLTEQFNEAVAKYQGLRATGREALIERIHNENARIAAAESIKFLDDDLTSDNLHPNSELERHERFKPKLIAHLRRIAQQKAVRQKNYQKDYTKCLQKWNQQLELYEKKKIMEASEYQKIITKTFPKRKLTPAENVKVEGKVSHVMPPNLIEPREREYRLMNKNGLIRNIKLELEENAYLNKWADEDHKFFKEKFVEYPKDFGQIARSIGKPVQDCVLHYYATKKFENYKLSTKKRYKKKLREANSHTGTVTEGITTRRNASARQESPKKMARKLKPGLESGRYWTS